MLTLAPALLAAQRSPSRAPAVTVQVTRQTAGVDTLQFAMIHQDPAASFPHAAVGVPTGTLVRARVVSGTLSYQRVPNAGPGGDFTSWTALGPAGGARQPALATRTSGGYVALANVQTDGRTIVVRESSDDGLTFGAPATAAVAGGPVSRVALGQSSFGDLLLVYAVGAAVYTVRRTAGVWDAPQAWPHSVSTVYDLGCSYGGDFHVFVAGEDAAGPKVWGASYGDGLNYPPGVWSPLTTIAQADAGSGVSFYGVTGLLADVYRAAWVEQYTGTGGYTRVVLSHMPVAVSEIDPYWREPAPLPADPGYTPSLTVNPAGFWLVSSSEVWLAPSAPGILDVSDDVLQVTATEAAQAGDLQVTLRNDHHRFDPGTEDGDRVAPGDHIDVSFGYQTAEGPKYGVTLGYRVERVERVVRDGRKVVTLWAHNGWGLLAAWTAPQQLQWPQGTDSIYHIAAHLNGRVGLRTGIRTGSPQLTGLKPAFTVYPGERGDAAIRRLFAMVPDRLIFENHQAIVLNPAPADAPSYTYGAEHPILEAAYRTRAEPWNAVRVFGEGVVADAFLYESAARHGIRPRQVHDRTIGTAPDAEDRAAAVLEEARRAAGSDEITVPLNVGQRPFDVVTVDDPTAGITGVNRRVAAIVWRYHPARGVYNQTLQLELP